MKWHELKNIPEYYKENLELAREHEDGTKLLIFKHGEDDLEYWVTDELIEDHGTSVRGTAKQIIEEANEILRED